MSWTSHNHAFLTGVSLSSPFWASFIRSCTDCPHRSPNRLAYLWFFVGYQKSRMSKTKTVIIIHQMSSDLRNNHKHSTDFINVHKISKHIQKNVKHVRDSTLSPDILWTSLILVVNKKHLKKNVIV
jgi:hypothetical protein